MADFVTRTKALIAKLDDVLAATSTADWAQRLNKLKPELKEWRDTFTILVDPSDEELAAVVDYTTKLTQVTMLGSSFADTAPAAGGKRRKYTRRYCKKTPCRKMGFTQKASCRPYKNCYLTRS